MGSISEIWEEIATAYVAKESTAAPAADFLPPVPGSKIQEAEERLGVHLPREYRESLNVHNGTLHHVWLWDAVWILDLDFVIQWWLENLEMASQPHNQGGELVPTGPVLPLLFHRKWIPVASDNGIPICLDMAPDRGGSPGQVIYVDWEDGTVRVLAANFRAFLEQGLRTMRQGHAA